MNEISDFKKFLAELLQPIIQESFKKAIDETKQLDQETENEGFLTIEHAAQYLNLSVNTLYGMTSRKEIPFRKPGKKLYFLKSELEKWIAEGKVNTKEESQQKGIMRMKQKRKV